MERAVKIRPSPDRTVPTPRTRVSRSIVVTPLLMCCCPAYATLCVGLGAPACAPGGASGGAPELGPESVPGKGASGEAAAAASGAKQQIATKDAEWHARAALGRSRPLLFTVLMIARSGRQAAALDRTYPFVLNPPTLAMTAPVHATPPSLAEPKTPLWMPALGTALFLTAGLLWAATPPPPVPVAEEPGDAGAAIADAAADVAPAPLAAPASAAPSPSASDAPKPMGSAAASTPPSRAIPPLKSARPRPKPLNPGH